MKANWIVVGSVTFALAIVLVFGRCDQPAVVDHIPGEADTVPTIQQGVYGRVYFWEGDFMPTVPPAPLRGSITPVKRLIVIHPPTRIDSVNQVGYSEFYRDILTPRVTETISNARGFFQVELQPGRYSLFVVEDSLFYANGSDGQGYLWPVTVVRDSLSYMKLDITYKAAF